MSDDLDKKLKEEQLYNLRLENAKLEREEEMRIARNQARDHAYQCMQRAHKRRDYGSIRRLERKYNMKFHG